MKYVQPLRSILLHKPGYTFLLNTGFMFLALLPSLIAYSITHQVQWMHVAFFSACIYCAQSRLGWTFLPTLVHSLCVSGCIISLLMLQHSIWWFSSTVALIAAATMAITYYGKSFRSLCSWTIIPAVYIACELTSQQVAPFTALMLIKCIAVGLSGNLISLIGQLLLQKKYTLKAFLFWIELPSVKRDKHAISLSLGLFFIVFSATAIVELLHIQHGQWLIWSSISVATGELTSMLKKFKQRITYALCGLTIGTVALLLFPSLAALNNVWTLLIPFSLNIPHYELAFSSRNFFIALSSGALTDNHLADGFRIMNVFWGGAIGAIGGAISLVISRKYFFSRNKRDIHRC